MKIKNNVGAYSPQNHYSRFLRSLSFLQTDTINIPIVSPPIADKTPIVAKDVYAIVFARLIMPFMRINSFLRRIHLRMDHNRLTPFSFLQEVEDRQVMPLPLSPVL